MQRKTQVNTVHGRLVNHGVQGRVRLTMKSISERRGKIEGVRSCQSRIEAARTCQNLKWLAVPRTRDSRLSVRRTQFARRPTPRCSPLVSDEVPLGGFQAGCTKTLDIEETGVEKFPKGR